MHIDLNSCFATVEQQVNSHLRGRPIAIAAYTSPNGCVVSPSIEAKRYGVRVGMTVREAKLLCKEIIIRDPDPMLVRDVHIKYRNIFKDYSPIVVPKSIDEAIIDFEPVKHALNRSLEDIGHEIKKRLREEIGEWISCNVGIATNRFLAKVAANLHKPDGLDIITHENLLSVYQSLKLTDLPGINTRYEARLNTESIFTPIDFFASPLLKLEKRVFQSIVGYHWYMRLRGWEIDAIDFGRKSFGQDYALGKFTNSPLELSRLIMKLCMKMGRRLRKAGFTAGGIHVACIYADGTYWHRARKFQQPMYSTLDLYRKAQLVFNQREEKTKMITKLSVSCYSLESAISSQLTLFESVDKERKVSDATDKINDRYGEGVIMPALMLGMDNLIIDRIAFGGVSELENLYD